MHKIKKMNLVGAAKACGTTRQTIRRHIDSGALIAVQRLTRWEIKEEDLKKWAETQNLAVNL